VASPQRRIVSSHRGFHPRSVFRSGPARGERSESTGVVVLAQDPQCVERQRRNRDRNVAGRNRQRRVGDREQSRGGLCLRDRNADWRRVGCCGTLQLCSDGVRIAKQASEPADVEHHARRSMAFEARREIPRQTDQRLRRAG